MVETVDRSQWREEMTMYQTATTTEARPANPIIDELRAELRDIEIDVLSAYTLADAIREGARVTTQANGWGSGREACALSAAYLTAHARGWIE
jgi:hypothetical protein